MSPSGQLSRPREQFIGDGADRLYVRDVGHGMPVVVLHGGPDFDHAYLLPEMDGLAEAFRLVYYDQRGRGRSYSGQAPHDVSIASEVDDPDRVRGHLGLEAVAVLGHSWGALLAMEYAIRRPECVTHLVLMNAAPASRAGALAVRRELASRRARSEADRMAAIAAGPAYRAGDPESDAEYYRIHFRAGLRNRDHLERLVGRLRSAWSSDGILVARAIEDRLYEQTWNVARYDLIPRLRQLRVPALVIHGEDDFIPVPVVRRIADAIPSSRLVTLTDCGHFAYLEQPDLVRTSLVAFLTEPTDHGKKLRVRKKSG